MPSIAKQYPGKKIATRPARKARRFEPGAATNRPQRHAPPQSEEPAQRTTILLLQELVDMLRKRAAAYEHHPHASAEAGKSPGAAALRGLADEDLTHSRWLAERIAELGGTEPPQWPDAHPAAGLETAHDAATLAKAGISVADAVVDRYGRLLTLIGESDPTTRFLIEDIMFDELERFRERRAWLPR